MNTTSFKLMVYFILNDITEISICPICNKREQHFENDKGYVGRCGTSKCIAEYKKQNGIPYRSIESEKRRIANSDFKSIGEKNSKIYWSKTKEERKKISDKRKNTFSKRTSEQIKKSCEKRAQTYIEQPERLEAWRKTMKETISKRSKKEWEKIKQKTIKTLMEKHGVTNSFLISEIYEKAHSKETRDKAGLATKETWSKKSKEEKQKIQEKRKNTYKEKTGYLSPLKNPEIQNKIKKTLIDRYGYDNPLKVPEIKKRAMTNYLKNNGSFESAGKKSKITKINENLFCQGSFELDFVKKYLEKFPNLKNPKSFTYSLNGHDHLYFPDFYIEEMNLIVEIKSNWTFDRRGTCDDLRNKNFAKWDVVKNNGFNFISIIDKNYTEFESLCESLNTTKEGQL
jgi:hypothetical protein